MNSKRNGGAEMPGIPPQLIQLFAQMSEGGDMGGMGHDHAKMLRDQAKTKRDFVSENSPRKEPSGGGLESLMALFSNMSEGESRRVSVEGGAGGDANQTTGVYPWPTLAPSMAEVPSVMPQAEAMGGLNEQLIRDYMDAMNVYNQGGKGEKIASIIAGLAGAGGYIADRTSGDADRRRRAGGYDPNYGDTGGYSYGRGGQYGSDLDYALQNLFSIPQGMRAKRQGQMTQAMSSAEMRHKLRTGTVGGVEHALTEDDRKSFLWHGAAQKAESDRARIAASGSKSREDPRYTEYKEAEKQFYRLYNDRIGPGKEFKDQTSALADFQEHYGLESSKISDIWKTPQYETVGNTYTGMRDKYRKEAMDLYGQDWKDAAGDEEARKKIEYLIEQHIRKGVTDELRLRGENINPEDILPPMAETGDEITEGGDERDWLDKIGGGIGGFLGIGTERGGAAGAYEGWVGAPPDEGVAGALDSITGGGDVGQNVEQVEGGVIVYDPNDPNDKGTFIPTEQKKKKPVGMDLSNMLEYIRSLAGGK